MDVTCAECRKKTGRVFPLGGKYVCEKCAEVVTNTKPAPVSTARRVAPSAPVKPTILQLPAGRMPALPCPKCGNSLGSSQYTVCHQCVAKAMRRDKYG